MEGQRPTRTQDFIQAGLILVLTVLLLISGVTAVGYMFRSEIAEDKHAVAQKENQLLLRSVETDLRLRIDRVRDVSENDSFTKDRRLRLLEERADILEKELAEQKRELNKLKQK